MSDAHENTHDPHDERSWAIFMSTDGADARFGPLMKSLMSVHGLGVSIWHFHRLFDQFFDVFTGSLPVYFLKACYKYERMNNSALTNFLKIFLLLQAIT